MNCFKKWLRVACTCTAVISTIPTVSATPVIGIGSMYDVLTTGTQSIAKRIYNSGDSTAFVRVEILQIHPGKINEAKETPQKEVSGNTLEKDRLIVTPLRMIIPPSGFQSVRILWPGDRSVERYFRVRFTPVMPELNDGFGLDPHSAGEYRKTTLKAGLNVLTGYGTIVVIQPDNPVFNTVVDNADPGKVTVSNAGNATISLDNVRSCKSAVSDCGEITREFIFPGKSKSVVKKSGYKTNFTLIEGNTKRALTY